MDLNGYVIGVLEYKHCAGREAWTIRSLEQAWENAGACIRQYSNLSKPPPKVDIWFCHLDSTRMPEGYRKFIDAQPRVVNGELKDIRKTSFSEQLIDSKESSYKGQVIVKSDYNCGGIGDMRMVKGPPGVARYLPATLRRWMMGIPSGFKPIESYIVYDMVKAVPDECFSDEYTVVEKFLPEKVGRNFALRMMFKLGECVVTYRIISSDKVVKHSNLVSIEQIDTDSRVVDWARLHCVDFGKIDYVICDGKLVVYDVNRTPGSGRVSDENRQAVANCLASGILAYLPSRGS